MKLKSRHKEEKRREVKFMLLTLMFMLAFFIAFNFLDVESFYKRLMVPICMFLILQLIVTDYYSIKIRKGIWPNIISVCISVLIYWLVFGRYEIDLYLKEVHLSRFLLENGIAAFGSLLLIHYTLGFLFPNTVKKTVSNKATRAVKKRLE